MYKVLLAPGAKRELRNALAYIKRKLRIPIAATRLADEAKPTLRNLRSMPERYPFCDDPVLRLQGYRHAPVVSLPQVSVMLIVESGSLTTSSTDSSAIFPIPV